MARAEQLPRSGGYMGALILGLTLGAVTAILFAPKRGDELRQDIKEKASDARRRAYDTWERMRERLEQSAKETKQTARKVKKDIFAEEA